MGRHWTFGQKLGAGFAVTVALTVAIGAISIYALRSVVTAKDRVITVHNQALIDAAQMVASLEEKVASTRGFLLSREERSLERAREARAEFIAVLRRLTQDAPDEATRQLLATVERSEAEHERESEQVIAVARTTASAVEVNRAFEDRLVSRRAQIDADLDAFVARTERIAEDARLAATRTASSATTLTAVIAVAVVLFATLVAFILSRAVSAQIGTAVGQVQSSSAELQATANQQATGAKEQSTAMSEITTTISELLATSRQIAESAQRVAQIAAQTATAARAGGDTVEKANESSASIRRQVDLVVSHMLELGTKSQEIGAVLDIVFELAEQTNILSINATIEAAGAGESGKRFAVVADEIRKLADRVAASTKEIRTLIDDVRSAVNTTVMATETGSKAVESGSRQFGDVAASFKQIADLVSTTTEAAREIELSTKQQATAVEQVNVAITNAAQATRETEASSGQTLQTASRLAGLSKDLLRLVQPQAVS